MDRSDVVYLTQTLAEMEADRRAWIDKAGKLEADNAERKKIIEFCQKRIAELEKEVCKLGLRCDLLADEKDELREALEAVEKGFKDAPLSDTWWYSETETMLDYIRQALDKYSCSVTNTSTSADLQVSITDRECLCGEINGRHCPIHQEPSCPIHGTEKMVDGVCHGTHVREGSTELNGDSE